MKGTKKMAAARLYFVNKGAGLGSFGVFVTYLTIADFFMGVYLAIVGVDDQVLPRRIPVVWRSVEGKCGL